MQDRAYERRSRAGFGVLLTADGKIQSEDAFRTEPGIHAIEKHKRFDHESGPDQEHQGQADLGHHQSATNPVAAAALSDPSAAFFQRVVYIHPREAQRRRHSGPDSNRERQRQREGEHGGVDRNSVQRLCRES